MWGWLDDEPLTVLHLLGGNGRLGGGSACQPWRENIAAVVWAFGLSHYLCAPFVGKNSSLMYAIVEIAGHQYKVEKDQQVFVNRLDAEEGKKSSSTACSSPTKEVTSLLAPPR